MRKERTPIVAPPGGNDETRQALIALDPFTLRGLLDLPPGYRIEQIDMDRHPLRIIIIVSSPDLDPVPPGAVPPFVHGTFYRESIWPDDGTRSYVRFGWEKS